VQAAECSALRQVYAGFNKVVFLFEECAERPIAPGSIRRVTALSESGGPLRCLKINSGQEMWKYTPPFGNHILHVGYCENYSRFLAIEWPYEKGGTKRFLQLSRKNGSILDYIDLGEPIDCCFAFSGKFLVTTSGDVMDTATGTATKISS
jgi:hypothetical protein